MADKLSFPEFVREFWTAEQEKASPLTGWQQEFLGHMAALPDVTRPPPVWDDVVPVPIATEQVPTDEELRKTRDWLDGALRERRRRLVDAVIVPFVRRVLPRPVCTLSVVWDDNGGEVVDTPHIVRSGEANDAS